MEKAKSIHSTSPGDHKLRVLVVEDSKLDYRLLLAELGRNGIEHDAKRVDTREDLQRELHEYKPDLVISDYVLPALNGMETLHTVLQFDPFIPVIIVTGSINEETPVECIKAGAVDYVNKDQIKRLGPAVKLALERKEEKIAHEQSEKALRKLSSAVGNTEDSIVITDRDGVIEFVNPAFERTTGYRKEEVLGKTPRVLKSGHQSQEFYKTMWENLLSGKTLHVEFLNRRKNGTLYYQDETITPIVDSKGNITSFVSTGRDVTERKRAELALRESQERYSKVFSASPVGISVATLEEGRFKEANEAFLALYGYAREEVIGHTSKDLGIWVDQEDRHRIVNILKEHNKLSELETEIRTKSGEIKQALFSAEVIEVDGERLILGLMQDITGRKRAENTLRETEYWIRESQRVARIGSYVTDFISGYWKSSEVLDEIFGIDSDYIRSVDGWSQLVHPDDRLELNAYLEDIIARKQPFNKEYRIVRRNDGMERWVFGRGELTYDKQGKLLRMIGTIQDITERRVAERALLDNAETFSSLFNSTSDGVVIHEEGKILEANSALTQLSGYSHAELIGKNVVELVALASRDLVVKKLQSKYEKPIEVLGLRKDGIPIPVELSTASISYLGRSVRLTSVRDISERRAAEQAVRFSEDRFRSVWEHSVDGMRLTDREGRIVAVNDAFCRLVKIPREKLLGRSFSATYRENGLDDGIDVYKKRFDSHQIPSRISASVTLWNNEVVELDISNSFIEFGVEDKLILSIFRNTTEQSRAERALQESEEKLRLVFENAFDGISIFEETSDPSLRKLVDCNARYAEMSGRTKEELLSHGNMDELSKTLSGDNSQAIAEGKVFRGTYTWLRPDGKDNVIEYTAVPIKLQGKTFTIGIDRDVTERKHAEEQIRLLAYAITSISQCVSITDLENRLTFVNEAFLQTYGYQRSEIIGQPISVVTSPNNPQDITSRVLSATIGGGWNGEMLNRKKDGTDFPVLLSTSVVRSEKGDPIALIGVATDLTDRKKADDHRKILETQLAQAQKMESIGTLAGGIAHDFNNILGIILGHLSILQRQDYDASLHVNSFETITKAVQRGADLVRQILTFARKTNASSEQVNVGTIAQELSKMLRETFPKTIDISIDAEPDLPTINADPTQFHQALMNLCINARDAMMDRDGSNLGSGKLHIEMSRISGLKLRSRFQDADASEYVSVAVSDTGIGFDETTKQKIFEPFFTTKETGKGTGLGLAVVYGVVTSHQGFIEVESQVGRGTTFTLHFPATTSHRNEEKAKSVSAITSYKGNESILVVEDEEGLRTLMQIALERNGYKVITAKDGVEAIEQFEKHRKEIALVLTDMGLPKLDGSEMFATLKMREPKIKVILASGYLEPQYKKALLKAGAKDFVQKPYVPEEVLRKIRRTIDSK